MDELDELRSELGRRRDKPGRAPMMFNTEQARLWIDGYKFAMNEAANVVAAKKWARKGKGNTS